MLLLSFLLRVWHMQTICLVLEQFLYKINVFFFFALERHTETADNFQPFHFITFARTILHKFPAMQLFWNFKYGNSFALLIFLFFFLRESRHVRLIKIEASCQCFIKISASCFGDPHMYVALGSLVRFECQKGVATWWLFYFLIFVKVYYGQMLTFNATYVKLF